MARSVDECYLFSVPQHVDAEGPDLLSYAALLFLGYVPLPEKIDQSCLSVIHMAHDCYHWTLPVLFPFSSNFLLFVQKGKAFVLEPDFEAVDHGDHGNLVAIESDGFWVDHLLTDLGL